MLESYSQFCIGLKRTGKHRQLLESPGAKGTPWLDFSSNDYLGLSRRKEVLEAAYQAGMRDGVGATGSRLLSGNRPQFEAFESRIASNKGTESALIFNTGFQANVTALSSLLDSRVLKAKPLVFFDRLNHASLYQAIFLSGAELIRYKHLDLDHLSRCLDRHKGSTRPKFIVTETLFGMDGDVLPIGDLMTLARTHQAFVYLDEAHAVGILGTRGYGLSTLIEKQVIDQKDDRLLIMGTLSKAVGCAGAYVACSQVMKDYLINKAAGFIYSTASSPLVMGASAKAWEMMGGFETERQTLLQLADSLRSQLITAGFDTGASSAHIIPLMVPSEALYAVHRKLQSEGIGVSLVRPPTVPPGTARLRIALNLTHTKQDISRLMDALTS
jgi:8-amino-7-oxononanoate synthase